MIDVALVVGKVRCLEEHEADHQEEGSLKQRVTGVSADDFRRVVGIHGGAGSEGSGPVTHPDATV